MNTSWLNDLLPASFRSVPFHVSSTSSEFGRRNQTHEYPLRDVPYTEDLGRSARKNKIEAFLVGDDHKEQAEKLAKAIEEDGAGTLIHPFLGELNVNIAGPAMVSDSVDNRRMSVVSFSFIEAGELIFPDSSVATDDVVNENADNVDQELLDAFEDFDLIDAPDFIQENILDNTMTILNGIADTFNTITPYVREAVKIMNGDLSSILGAGGSSIVNSIKSIWGSATRFTNSVKGLISRVKVFTGTSFVKNLSPIGVWPTDSRSTKQTKKNQNIINTAMRVTALTEASRTIASLPKQTKNDALKRVSSFPPVGLSPVASSTVNSSDRSFNLNELIENSQSQQQIINRTSNTNTTTIVNSENTVKNNTISFDDLLEIKDAINALFDIELSRTQNDKLYIALLKLKAAVNQDINERLIKIEKTIVYIPDDVLPDLVLSHYLYNNSERCDDISTRNNILHPGFVPVRELRVPKS